jgi:quinol monooxygenase YgiN
MIMMNIVAQFNLKEGAKAPFIDLAKELILKSKEESGNISYDLFEDLNDENKVAFIEEWLDKEAHALHRETDHFTRIVPLLGALQEGPAQVSFYRIIKK